MPLVKSLTLGPHLTLAIGDSVATSFGLPLGKTG